LQLKQKFQPISGETWKQFFISIYRYHHQEKVYEKISTIEQKILIGNGGIRKYLYTGEVALQYQISVTLTNGQSGWLALTSFPRLVFRTEGRRKNQTISINILSSKTTIKGDGENLLIITASGEYSFKGTTENIADWVYAIKDLVTQKKNR